MFSDKNWPQEPAAIFLLVVPAATMVGKTLEPEDASHQLCKMLKDESVQVRKNTSLALMKMEATEAINQIREAMTTEQDDQVKSVMSVAVSVLEKS